MRVQITKRTDGPGSCAACATRELSFDEIVRVKKKRGEQFQQRSAIAPGATLELQFEIPALTEL